MGRNTKLSSRTVIPSRIFMRLVSFCQATCCNEISPDLYLAACAYIFTCRGCSMLGIQFPALFPVVTITFCGVVYLQLFNPVISFFQLSLIGHGDNICRLHLWWSVLHLARGSLVREQTGVSWGGWHAGSSAVSMAFRWYIIFLFKSFHLLLANTRNRADNDRFMKKGERNFLSTTGLFYTHLPPTPAMQCWQSQAASCCEDLQLSSSLSQRQRGAAALHISWERLWIHNVSPRHALSARPSTVRYRHQALLICLKLLPAFGKWQSPHPPLSSFGSLERRCKMKACSALCHRHIWAQLCHLPQCEHGLCVLSPGVYISNVIFLESFGCVGIWTSMGRRKSREGKWVFRFLCLLSKVYRLGKKEAVRKRSISFCFAPKLHGVWAGPVSSVLA